MLNAPTSFPDALKRLEERDAEVKSLKAALDFGTIPAWVCTEIRQENLTLIEVLRRLSEHPFSPVRDAVSKVYCETSLEKLADLFHRNA